jgi:hypothetical protein
MTVKIGSPYKSFQITLTIHASVGKEPIAIFEFTTWHASFTDFFHKAPTAIWKQLLFANDTTRVLVAVLGLSQDGACTDFFENFRENSLKGDLSNDITLNPPLFSLVDTFKKKYNIKTHF